MNRDKQELDFIKRIEEFHGRKMEFDENLKLFELFYKVVKSGGFESFKWENEEPKMKILYRNILLDYERNTFSKKEPNFVKF